MKLAEALIERADLKTKISQIERRMETNTKVQEGDEPAESIDMLILQYESLMDDLENLIIRINKTNSTALFDDRTMAEAIGQRDNLKSKIRSYMNLRDSASFTHDRYSNTEIKYVRCINVKDLQYKIDALSRTYRELDTKLQGLNWTIDLI
jgi:hypothetical protein